MKNPKMTEPRIRGLKFMPADGSWVMNVGKEIAPALSSLAFGELVEVDHGPFGPRGGYAVRYRLTAKGIKLKAQMEPQNNTP